MASPKRIKRTGARHRDIETVAPCNNCKTETLHLVKNNYRSNLMLHGAEESGEEFLYKIPDHSQLQILECRGCLGACFREIITYPVFGKHGFAIEGKSIIKINYYPPRSVGLIPKKDFITLPAAIQSTYEEVIDAYNQNLSLLCAAGLRVLVEAVCENLVVKGSNLKQRIASLSLSGKLSKETCQSLQAHRFLGNKALHSIEIPSKQELSYAIDLLEHALKEIYRVPASSKELADLMTKRILSK